MMFKKFLELYKELRKVDGFKTKHLFTRKWLVDNERYLNTYEFVRFLKDNNLTWKTEEA